MKAKITLDRYAGSSRKSDVLTKIIREVGAAKVTISGDVVVVNDSLDESRVVDILRREGIDYSRATAY